MTSNLYFALGRRRRFYGGREPYRHIRCWWRRAARTCRTRARQSPPPACHGTHLASHARTSTAARRFQPHAAPRSTDVLSSCVRRPRQPRSSPVAVLSSCAAAPRLTSPRRHGQELRSWPATTRLRTSLQGSGRSSRHNWHRKKGSHIHD
jgi:hypothetical protein